MNIHFEGIERVNSILQKVVNQEKIQQALAQAGEEVRGNAVANAPEDTGRLKGSIVCNVDGNRAEIGPSVDYGIYVEYGTGSLGDPSVAHTTKDSWVAPPPFGFKTMKGTAPKPFLVPALKDNEDKIIDKFKEVISL